MRDEAPHDLHAVLEAPYEKMQAPETKAAAPLRGRPDMNQSDTPSTPEERLAQVWSLTVAA
jgi:hypothetical protein